MHRRSFLALAASCLAVGACGAPPVRTAARPAPGATLAPAPAPTIAPTPDIPAPAATPHPSLRPLQGVAERILVRGGAGDGAGVAAVDAASGTVAFRLPGGFPKPDGAQWVGLVPSGATTSADVFSLRHGGRTASIPLPGRFGEGAISHNGAWLLATDAHGAGGSAKTRMVLVDLRAGAIAEEVELAGAFLPDSVDDTGQAIYLIQLLPEQRRDAYAVMLYDRQKHALQGKLADKRSATTVMSGKRVRQAWSGSGEWLYSLYLDPGGDGAFVHALDVKQRFAVCIDLPSNGADDAQVRQYELARSPVTDRLYAVNPAMGAVSTFGVGDFDARTFKIEPAAPIDMRNAPAAAAYNDALVTTDGKALLVGTPDGILRIPTTNDPATMLLAGMGSRSLGTGPSDAVYALVGSEPRLIALDPATGEQLGDFSGIVAQPVGIEGVVGA